MLQKRLAAEITTMVHSEAALENAIKASSILFGKSTGDDLKALDEQTFLDVFDGVPQAEIAMAEIEKGYNIVAAMATDTQFLKSNSEVRRAIKQNSIAVNKEKVSDEDYQLTTADLINDKFILLQRGKKSYFVLRIV